MTETNRIEFKRELTKELDIEKEVVAFLNYREGGIIYIGIDDSGKPVGVKDIDGVMLKIKDRIRSGISPSPMGLFDVTVEHVENVPVIKVFVSSGSEKPYCKTKYGLSERGCFIRVGTAAEPMPIAMIDDLYAHRVRNSLRNIRSPRKNLTFRQLHIYYESKGLMLNEHFMENLDLLTDANEPNYVAYLLADENSTSIKVAKYAGTDRDILIANNELGYCSLLKATDQVLDKLKVENNVSSEITYKRRIESPLWDERAMREIVINAIVHNDYYTNEVPPKFEIFSDRIEITSAGRLPIDMTQEEFFGGVSSPRNKELMRVFRDVDLVESLGSGMKRIGKVYSLKDIFSFTTNFIRTSIPFHSQKTGRTPSDDTVFDNVNDNSGNANDTINQLEPTKRQLDILCLIANVANGRGSVNGSVKSGLTTKEIVSKLNWSERVIYRELATLKQLGLIQRIGSDKNGFWAVAKEGENVLYNGSVNGNVNGSVNIFDELSERQKDIVIFIQNIGQNITENVAQNVAENVAEKNKVNTKYLADKLGVSRKTVQRELAELAERQIVQWVGSDKTGHWEVTCPSNVPQDDPRNVPQDGSENVAQNVAVKSKKR